MKVILVGLILSSIFFLGCQKSSTDFKKGLKAYEDKDYGHAYKLFTKSCDDGNVNACYNLGHMYGSGVGTKKDILKSKALMELACKDDVLEACVVLAGYYVDKTQGINKNDFKAFNLYTKACDGKVAIGCSFLGIMYLNGRGVKQDYKQAKYFLGKGCELGDSMGCEGYSKLNQ